MRVDRISIAFSFLLALVNSQNPQQYSKLLVTTGQAKGSYARKSEVIDLVTGKTCDSLEDYPVGTSGGTGALLNGLYPLVCGGYVSERPNTNKCKILGSTEQEFELNMVETRDSASSILIYPSTVWITGGKHFVEGSPLAVRLASTEYLSLTDESANGPGPDLPIHVWGHCVLSNYETQFYNGILLTGGVSNEHYSSARTYFFDLISSAWTEAPKMNTDRYMHGCATFKNEGKTYAVAAGGYSITQGGMSSVEFLSLEEENAEWAEGPSMPRELMEFTLVTSPEEDGVLAVGGISGSTREAAIFKMTCTGSLNCEWTELEQTLDIGRSDHVAFLIPDELTSCK